MTTGGVSKFRTGGGEEVCHSNPWGAKGLEWQTSSPPPVLNFETPPVVTEEAYAYETSAPAKEVPVGV